MQNEEKLKAAIEYLRHRNKYILECKWVPTPAEKTDVRKTMQEYWETLGKMYRITGLCFYYKCKK